MFDRISGNAFPNGRGDGLSIVGYSGTSVDSGVIEAEVPYEKPDEIFEIAF